MPADCGKRSRNSAVISSSATAGSAETAPNLHPLAWGEWAIELYEPQLLGPAEARTTSITMANHIRSSTSVPITTSAWPITPK
jgi:hypothetical protein